MVFTTVDLLVMDLKTIFNFSFDYVTKFQIRYIWYNTGRVA